MPSSLTTSGKNEKILSDMSEELENNGPSKTVREQISVMSFSQVGLFVLAVGYTTFLIRPALLPIIIALLLTLIFKPVQRRLQSWLRFPAPLAALVVILGTLAVGVVGIASLTQPVIGYIEQLRGEEVQDRISKVFKPISDAKQEITEVAAEVRDFADTPLESPPGTTVTESTEKGGDSKVSVDVQTEQGNLAVESSASQVDIESTSPPMKVEISNTEDPASSIYTLASHLTFDLLAITVLLFFFLAYGDTMIKRMAEVDGASKLMEELSQDVSHYLFSITAINLCLGFAIGIAMWILGMPNPILWGVMAALFNYIPYIGAIAGTGIVFIVATATFEQTHQTIPVALAYYGLTAIEGNFITPALIGRKFTINPIIVFAWVFCWGIMWGVPGMLIGLPLLMVFRIVCAKLPSLERLERVISI